MKNMGRFLSPRVGSPSEARHGFTIVELLAVLAMLGLLALLLVPTMAGTRNQAPAFVCRNNLRQLALAWSMYAQDNRERVVYNTDGGMAGQPGSPAWVGGWLDFSTGAPMNANTNVAMLVDHKTFSSGAFLGPYVNGPGVFKCPADPSMANLLGVKLPRVRSVSMNNYLGVNSRAWASPGRYRLCASLAQLKFPAGMFVILDERFDSINDGWFASDPDTAWQLIDYPAAYHNGSGNFCFADGHVELHRWKDPRTNPTLLPGRLLPLNQNYPNDVDIPWLQQRAAGVQVFP